jgi:hypothetical protein
MALTENAVEALEIDAFAANIADLIFKGTDLYSLMKKRAQVVPVSNVTAAGGVTRPSFRIPFRVQSGSPITQSTGDNASIGQGTGSNWQSFAVSPVWIQSVCQISSLAQLATKGKDRGLVKVQAEELKNALNSTKQGIEALMNGDGSGAITQIPATATVSSNSGSGAQTSFISGLNQVASFVDQQVVQVFPSVGGTARTPPTGGTVISYIDAAAGTIYFSTALPTGTVAGDFLMVQGAAGSAGSSVLGIQAWDANTNVGTIGGLNRANFPGRLSCPTINLAGGSITPGVGNRALVIAQRALGPDNKLKDAGVWYAGDAQAVAVNNLYTNVQITGLASSQVAGDKTPDISKKYFSDTFCGREITFSSTFLPNRMDLLVPELWAMGELAELGQYDFGGGNTIVPTPDTSTTTGTYLQSSMFSYFACFNLVNTAPRAGLFIQQAAVPTI